MKRKNVYTLLCLSLLLLSTQLAFGMGRPPYSAMLKSALGERTKNALRNNSCLSKDDILDVTSEYTNLLKMKPINNVFVTMTILFKGRDSKGSRAITLNIGKKTNADGRAFFAYSIDDIERNVNKLLRQDKFYKGVSRVRGPIELSFITQDTFERSVRYSPRKAIVIKLCES